GFRLAGHRQQAAHRAQRHGLGGFLPDDVRRRHHGVQCNVLQRQELCPWPQRAVLGNLAGGGLVCLRVQRSPRRAVRAVRAVWPVGVGNHGLALEPRPRPAPTPGPPSLTPFAAATTSGGLPRTWGRGRDENASPAGRRGPCTRTSANSTPPTACSGTTTPPRARWASPPGRFRRAVRIRSALDRPSRCPWPAT